ncbi:MAG TPA: FAD-dependent oxidoreductase [Candidatus Eisenbacteria bacterium]|nr:FAD-dependent oxidoreductase [Candidatus Eisenbacteria bacterium]
MRHRSEAWRKINGASFDVCVIGGGATGSGTALDAQLRGLSTVLIEAGDFASATSSRSTKLIHGGIRYLQEAVTDLDPGQYNVVKRALHERRIMMENARFLAHAMEFLVPCYSWWEAFYYGIGTKIYDRIAGKQNFFPSRLRSAKDAVSRWPLLQDKGLKGAIAYADGQFDDARYAVALVQTFAEAGGEAVNHARVVRLQPDAGGKISEAELDDQITGARTTVRARVFVNCTGPYSDHIRAMANPGLEKRLRLSKGVHILLPLDDRTADAMVVPKTDDGRVIFAIPWLGRLLVGTTDDEVTHDDELVVKRSEAEYLLQQLNRYLSRPFASNDIVGGFAGVRPLVSQGKGAKTKKLIREHEVEVDRESGLISVLGGKWTTYRAMAEDAVDAVQQQLGLSMGGCITRDRRLSGSEGYSDAYPRTLADSYGVPKATARHLSEKLGTRAAAVLELAKREPELAQPVVEEYPAILAEIAYAARFEMAATLDDVLERRTGLQFYSWQVAMAAAPVTAQVMQREMGWDDAQTQRQVKDYVNRLAAWTQKIGLAKGAAMA